MKNRSHNSIIIQEFEKIKQSVMDRAAINVVFLIITTLCFLLISLFAGLGIVNSEVVYKFFLLFVFQSIITGYRVKKHFDLVSNHPEMYEPPP